MERNYFMVRAMRSTEQELDLFVQNGVVGVGWSDTDFAAFGNDVDRLIEQVRAKYYSY